MKLLVTILALSISISAQTVIQDNDSVTIKGDADVSGVGKVEIQTRNIPRVTIANDGKVGLGVTSPQATLHFGGTSELGFEQTMRVETNEVGTAPFGWTLAKYAGSNGETRQDNQFCWGYNVGPGGAKLVVSEHAYGHCIENRFKTPEGHTQLEEYNFFLPGDDCVGSGCAPQRSMSVTPNLTTGEVINRAEKLHIMRDNLTKQILDQDLSFFDPTSRINFQGARTSNGLMFAQGSTILSFRFSGANKLDIFPTGIGDAEVGLMNASAPQSVLTLNFGGAQGSLNPNGIGIRKDGPNGMQVNHGSGWGKIATVITPCAHIDPPQSDERINNVALIAVMNCLKSLGLLVE